MATEREQLPRERNGAVGGLKDLGGSVLAALTAKPKSQQLRVTADDGQDIVEVVGAGGTLARR